ncbi:MAG: hypothetical protein ACTS4U_01410 [Candidatus Hodgkinia cicadicola]
MGRINEIRLELTEFSVVAFAVSLVRLWFWTCVKFVKDLFYIETIVMRFHIYEQKEIERLLINWEMRGNVTKFIGNWFWQNELTKFALQRKQWKFMTTVATIL